MLIPLIPLCIVSTLYYIRDWLLFLWHSLGQLTGDAAHSALRARLKLIKSGVRVLLPSIVSRPMSVDSPLPGQSTSASFIGPVLDIGRIGGERKQCHTAGTCSSPALLGVRLPTTSRRKLLPQSWSN